MNILFRLRSKNYLILDIIMINVHIDFYRLESDIPTTIFILQSFCNP